MVMTQGDLGTRRRVLRRIGGELRNKSCKAEYQSEYLVFRYFLCSWLLHMQVVFSFQRISSVFQASALLVVVCLRVKEKALGMLRTTLVWLGFSARLWQALLWYSEMMEENDAMAIEQPLPTSFSLLYFSIVVTKPSLSR